MAKKQGSLTEAAVKELERLLGDPDKKVRLRAISLILRHAGKTFSNRQEVEPLPLDSDFDKLLKSFEESLRGEK
jgi:HEAT repeat protein